MVIKMCGNRLFSLVPIPKIEMCVIVLHFYSGTKKGLGSTYCGGACGSSRQGTMLQAGRTQIRFPVRSLDFSVDKIIPDALGLTHPLTE
jgi:hypothetical protein